mmetsp:Transcript_1200/g.3343  ORF Transcript_1200/g.3343 Transcript_1200/m.3343 type:complete len:248 (+) Transcript_1200:1930-2673(+)
MHLDSPNATSTITLKVHLQRSTGLGGDSMPRERKDSSALWGPTLQLHVLAHTHCCTRIHLHSDGPRSTVRLPRLLRLVPRPLLPTVLLLRLGLGGLGGLATTYRHSLHCLHCHRRARGLTHVIHLDSHINAAVTTDGIRGRAESLQERHSRPRHHLSHRLCVTLIALQSHIRLLHRQWLLEVLNLLGRESKHADRWSLERGRGARRGIPWAIPSDMAKLAAVVALHTTAAISTRGILGLGLIAVLAT